MQLHEWDCEVYQLADTLKDFLKYEETIDDYDTRKHVGILIDSLIDSIKEVNETIGELTHEARTALNTVECLEDELYSERQIMDELRDALASRNEDAEMMVKFRKIMRGEL